VKPPPPGPPDVGDLRDLIDQWTEFVTDLQRNGYGLDLDNWLNDVDVRELILEALPMFGREELGELAPKLEAADQAFLDRTRPFKHCVWGSRTARKEKWTAQKNWWYFRTPAQSNTDLEDDLAKVR
jgi:hypothetical protein